MPRENNPNILLKARKLPAKTDEPLQFIHQALSLPLPLAKPVLTVSSPPQFHPETTVPEPGLQATAKAGEWTPADEVRLSEMHN
jgi:hypothetical protein